MIGFRIMAQLTAMSMTSIDDLWHCLCLDVVLGTHVIAANNVAVIAMYRIQLSVQGLVVVQRSEHMIVCAVYAGPADQREQQPRHCPTGDGASTKMTG